LNISLSAAGVDQQGLQEHKTAKVQLQQEIRKCSRDYLGPGYYPDPEGANSEAEGECINTA